MSRKYELRKRAQHKEATRRRIVEAAIELHATVGPARTTVSAIAERAGVQRHTYYSHFPDERSLADACSGLHLEQQPLPDPVPWREIPDPGARVRVGLGELYAYFEANEALLANVTRDAEVDDLTRDIFTAKIAPRLAEMRAVLASGFRARGRRRARVLAALELAVDFGTWRTLVRRSGLSTGDAAGLMADLVCSAR